MEEQSAEFKRRKFSSEGQMIRLSQFSQEMKKELAANKWQGRKLR